MIHTGICGLGKPRGERKEKLHDRCVYKRTVTNKGRVAGGHQYAEQ